MTYHLTNVSGEIKDTKRHRVEPAWVRRMRELPRPLNPKGGTEGTSRGEGLCYHTIYICVGRGETSALRQYTRRSRFKDAHR